MFFAYILKSKKNGQYYYGSTKDLKRREQEHNGGQVKATKYLRPLRLIYFERFKTLKEARRREYYFKKSKNKKYINWLIKRRKDL